MAFLIYLKSYSILIYSFNILNSLSLFKFILSLYFLKFFITTKHKSFFIFRNKFIKILEN